MPYPLNNFTTQDAYVAGSEIVFSPPRTGATMLVTNAAIYYKVAPAIDGHPLSASYQQEVFAAPGRYSFDNIDFPPSGKVSLMNVRSAVAGVPAQVTAY